MNKKLLNITPEVKKILKNVSYLSIFQVLNILIPIITIPYLLRTLGSETYGLVVFGQVVVSYFAILVNFGINNLAVGEVSLNQDNKHELSIIVSNVYFVKGFFFLVSFLFLFLLLFAFNQGEGKEWLLALSMWVCLYEFLVPTWYFQGTGKLKTLMILSLIGQIVFICLLLSLIKSPKDFLFVPKCYLINTLITGIGCIIILFKFHKLKLYYTGLINLLQFSKKSWNFFVSEISVKIFALTSKFIVGSNIGLTEVAYYDVIDKVINFFRVLPLGIARDAIYPVVSMNKDISIVRKTTMIMVFYSIFAILLIFFFSETVVVLIGGAALLPSANFLRFASMLIFTTHLSNYYITVGLWSFGYLSLFKKLMINSALLYVLLCCLLWQFKALSLYSLLLIPMIIDLYAILHYLFLYKRRYFSYNAIGY